MLLIKIVILGNLRGIENKVFQRFKVTFFNSKQCSKSLYVYSKNSKQTESNKPNKI